MFVGFQTVFHGTPRYSQTPHFQLESSTFIGLVFLRFHWSLCSYLDSLTHPPTPQLDLGYITLLLKTLQGLLMAIRFLLCPSSSPFFLLLHSALATLLFLEHPRRAFISGPLHCCFLCLVRCLYGWLPHLLQCLCRHCPLSEICADHTIQIHSFAFFNCWTLENSFSLPYILFSHGT